MIIITTFSLNPPIQNFGETELKFKILHSPKNTKFAMKIQLNSALKQVKIKSVTLH